MLQFDFFLQPHKVVAPEHAHPRQEERFQVVTGAMRGRVVGQERSVSPGQWAVVPPGTPHIWWNDGEGEVHLVVEFRPALRTEDFLETVFGLGRAGKGRPDGRPKSRLQMAVLLAAYRDEFYPVEIPSLVRQVMVVVVAPLARWLGYRPRYPEFSGPVTVSPDDLPEPLA